MSFTKNPVTINAKFLKATGYLREIAYADGSPGLQFLGNTVPETISINLGDYGLTPPEGHVYIKEYGEHEGVLEALIDQGIADPVGRVQFGPFNASAWLVRIDFNPTKEN